MNKVKPFFALILLAVMPESGMAQIAIGATLVDTSTVASNLDTPWEILWGPDDHIWITERTGRVSRLNPESGEMTGLAVIEGVHEQGESGLLGMALHPDFSENPHVFLVYTYLESANIKERLVRYTLAEGQLVSPDTLIEGIKGAGHHNGSRLIIDGNNKLFMTTGDAGDMPGSQDPGSLSGKVLRLNLDGSIPEDNPIPGSPVWSWGHRNPQGLVLAPGGILYSSEHGPSSNDEVNIIEKGRNYGWPFVLGFCDEATETAFCADSNVFEPIAAWTPTLAVAGTDYYGHEGIAEWNNSLLVTSLKASRLVALKLSPDGRSVEQEESYFTNWFGRLRDICVSPDGRVFLAVSNRDGRGSPGPADDRIIEVAASGTGVGASGEVEFSVFPNPVTGNEFTVEYAIGSEGVLIMLDPLGRELSRSILSPTEQNTRVYIPCQNGIYYLILKSSEGKGYMKLMKH